LFLLLSCKSFQKEKKHDMTKRAHAVEDGDFMEDVMKLVETNAKVAKVRNSMILNERVKMAYKTLYGRELELTPDLESRAFKDFYKVPDNFIAEYDGKIPPDDVLLQLFIPWARTGLQFNNDHNDPSVKARAINDFLFRRTQISLDTSKTSRMEMLDILWNSATFHAFKADYDVLQSSDGSDQPIASRLRCVRPRSEPRWTFAKITTYPTTERNLSFYQQMLKVLNDMARDFPNRSNNKNKKDGKQFLPTTSHVMWHYKTATLIAFHVTKQTRTDVNARFKPEPLCYALKGEQRPHKFVYPTMNENLEKNMGRVLSILDYDIDILRAYGGTCKEDSSKPIVENANDLFKNFNAVGAHVETMKKKNTRGVCYIDKDGDVSGSLSTNILYEHKVFLEACGFFG
jgi:hypothetical protein